MIVDGGNLDTVAAQRPHDRIDLGGDQYEIARDRSLALAGRLEVDSDRCAHRRWDSHAAFLDGVGTRDAELVDAAVGSSFRAQNPIECRSIEVYRLSRRWRRTSGRRERSLAGRERL